jgi:hypothetical protein
MIPSAPADVTPAWLEAVLRAQPDFADVRIRGVEPHLIGERYGLAGTVVRLDIRAGASLPFPLVAKLSAARPGAAEIGFYRNLAPRMPTRLPRFVAGACEGDRAFLLLEDVGPAEQGDVLAGATPEEADALMRTMGRFHAAFEGGEALDLPEWIPDPARAEKIRERAPRFLDRYGSDLRGLVASLPGLADEAAARLARARPTLVHGDLHLDNVLFPPGGEPVILDWTETRKGPAALDVAALLMDGLTPEQRRMLEGSLLDAYRGVTGIDLAEDVRAAYVLRLAATVRWAGAEDPGFHRPRVKEIVDLMVRNGVAAVRDTAQERARPPLGKH